MKAMILAAGRGERMRPLTDHTPKPLLTVADKALIVWHIERLVQAGFTELVINHAHLGQKIEETLGDGRRWRAQISYSPEKVALETAGGIANALHLLGNEPFLVVNGDVFCDIDFSHLKRVFSRANSRHLAHLVMVGNPLHHPDGDFVLAQGLIKEAGGVKLTFSGIGVYHPNLFADVVRGQPAKLAPLLRAAMAKSLVTGEYFKGAWHDIGTPERLSEIDAAIKQSGITAP